jgi:hypothetical protein
MKMAHGARVLLANHNQRSTTSPVLIEDSQRLDGRSSARTEHSEAIILRNRTDIIKYSNALIVALEEVLEYNVAKHHNSPPPNLRIEDPAYLAEVRDLASELRRLNILLEEPSRTKARVARQKIGRFGSNFDKFLGSYATALGKGAAALTIATAIGLLCQAGVGREIIDAIWEHARRR